MMRGEGRATVGLRAMVGAGAMAALLAACGGGATSSTDSTDSTDSKASTTATTVTTSSVPAPVDPVPITASSVADSRGIAPLAVPMDLAEVNARIGADLERDPGSVNPCASLEVDGADGVFLWLDGTTVTRVDVYGPSVRTTAGVRVGSSATEVRDAYGEHVRELDHPFDGWSQLVVDDPDAPEHGIAFILEGDVVESYRVGLTDAIGIWDCS